ncbi:MAG TPA: tetratricopeptide repeat protein [Terriglobia bacterium]|nr:tetratricopeptide repeat protein [Terriglobia bacterium]
MKRVIAILLLLFIIAPVLAAAPQTRTILVFPFENRSTSADLGWISEAFAQLLSTRLEGRGRFVLSRDERNVAYKQLNIPSDTPLALASEYEIAQTLGVDWVVVGSFKVTGQELSVDEQLLDVRALKLYPPIEETDTLANLIGVQDRLAWRLLVSYDSNFSGNSEELFAQRFRPVRLDAFENYIRGLLASDSVTKIHFLTAAESLDPTDHRAAFALGDYYFKEKDYSNSVTLLAKLDANDPDYLASLFLSGVDNFFMGRDADAEKEFETLSKQIPLSEVWNNLGVLETRGGDYKDALANFERAYQIDPADADYSFNLGACYSDLRRYSEAVTYLEKAETQNQNDLGVRTLLAYSMEKAGDRSGSQAQLSWVASHDGQAMADLNGNILPQPRLKKQYNGSAFRLLSVTVHNSLEDMLSKEPPEQHGKFHLLRGEDYVKQGRYPEAIHELSEATTLIPDDPDVHFFLGQAYEMHGDHGKAIQEFEAALRLNNSAVTHLWLAHAYLSLHQQADALAQGQAALALEPGNQNAQKLIDALRGRATPAQAVQ